jgi:acetyl-CoA C-acetyltransferase
MRRAVICHPVRTPVGRFGGVFRDVPVGMLGAAVVGAVLDRSGLESERVEEVILGHCYPNGENPAIGRTVALDAGLPVSTAGLQIDRRCGSGVQAIVDAVSRVESGAADVVLAGGVESMSSGEHYVLGARWGLGGSTEFHDRIARGRVTAGGINHPVPGGMLETAENLRREYSITREEQDAFALSSHAKAVAAADSGLFARELVPIAVKDSRGAVRTIEADEHPRRGLTIEDLAKLKPVRASIDPASTVTAGNASGQNDGAALCLVTTEEIAATLSPGPRMQLLSWAVAGVEPSRMGIGPVPASARALGRVGLDLDRMDIIEVNEAFAAQVLAVLRDWDVDPFDARLNPRGSGISLGHPVGATGTRIFTTMTNALADGDGTLGLVTLCVGGGQGITAVFERLG